MNESYNNIGKTKIGSIYLSAQRGFLDVFEKTRSLLFAGQEIAIFKGYFLPAFHGGRIFNIGITKILWLCRKYFLIISIRTAAKQNQ